MASGLNRRGEKGNRGPGIPKSERSTTRSPGTGVSGLPAHRPINKSWCWGRKSVGVAASSKKAREGDGNVLGGHVGLLENKVETKGRQDHLANQNSNDQKRHTPHKRKTKLFGLLSK